MDTHPLPDDALRELARVHGTPLYVYDTRSLEEAYCGLHRALPEPIEIVYSLKANPNLSVTALLASLGCGADVSSGAELQIALAAGVHPEAIVFTGPGKSRAELTLAVERRIGMLVCESADELALAEQVSARVGARTRVALRINPSFVGTAIESHMSGKPTQFGFDPPALRALEPRRYRHLLVDGLHVYMGSRVLDAHAITRNTEHILALAEQVSQELDIPLGLVDVGGGFGVAYFGHETPLDLGVLRHALDPVLAGFRKRNPGTRVLAESGRFLVAHAGVFLTEVLATKTSHGARYAVVDGGLGSFFLLSDNLAQGKPGEPTRNFPIRRLGAGSASEQPWTLAGPAPTPSDVLARGVSLPPLVPGDLLCIERAGAYGASASLHGFLAGGAPAEVMLHEGRTHVVRARDTLADVLRGQSRMRFDALAAPRAVAT